MQNKGNLSAGLLTAFLFLLLSSVANIVILALNLGPVFQIYAASDRIKELMDTPTTEPGVVIPQVENKGTIELKGVDFSYPKQDEIKVLRNVKIEVNDTKKVVALVGTSGCGKSSIISLIEQFYQAKKGEVLFNGFNINDINPRWYH
jgi:ATP-binding cassette subfamily B (MDR/TAP) protein 1